VQALSVDLAQRSPIPGDVETRDLLQQLRFNESTVVPTPQRQKTRQVLIIHGTWASKENWWKHPSPFTLFLDSVTKGAVYKGPTPFAWSGENNDAARRVASVELVNWISANRSDELIVVAHSHGGNVAMLAARQKKIDTLILLGTPIRSDYAPDVRNVSLLYNVYSLWDDVQKPLGTYPFIRGDGRTLGDSDKVVNVLVSPRTSHSDLHNDVIWRRDGLNGLLDM
jgi:pimeloyl-ACP methyl ester carboxylesterase